MNSFSLSLRYIRARLLSSSLNIVLLGLGIATLVMLLLVGTQVEQRFTNDAKGINLAVGAKGSPLQLVLSSVYHVDIPTGNIPLTALDTLRANPMVKQAIPLSMGDSYRGYRIIGTEPAYPQHYNGTLAEGVWFDKAFTAVLGSDVAASMHLTLGKTFVGNHGLAAGGEEHSEFPYTVVGILKPTGTVIDRLVLTPLESVWQVHEHHHHHHHDDGDEDEDHDEDHDHDEHEEHHDADHDEDHDHDHDEHHDEHEEHAQKPREITTALVTYKSPAAAVSMPRLINSSTNMQAAAPAMEMARLFHLLGIGLDTLRAFGALFIFTAALSLFIALYNAMQERRYDMAIMRSMGATPGRLLTQVLCEGLLITAAGTVLGLVAGHGVTQIISLSVAQARDMHLTGLVFSIEEVYIVLAAAVIGAIASLLPAIQAYRTDITSLLATRL